MTGHHHPTKKDFQVERIAFFSDAVFAIAITLLVIELRLPVGDVTEISEAHFWAELSALEPKILGFVISFFLIGLYWTIHHSIFGYVVDYSRRLVRVNLFFLFSIVVMPFTTAVYSEYSTPERLVLIGPYFIYVLNICLTGYFNFLLWKIVGDPSNRLAEHMPGGDFLRNAKIRSLLLPALFLLSLGISVAANPVVGRMALCLIPLAMRLVRNNPTA